jgi:hypothetical protein
VPDRFDDLPNRYEARHNQLYCPSCFEQAQKVLSKLPSKQIKAINRFRSDQRELSQIRKYNDDTIRLALDGVICWDCLRMKVVAQTEMKLK